MSVLSPRRATPELSLIVPAYNEAILLDSTVRRLHAVVAGLKVTYEIIIVDDGSSDGTAAIADRLAETLASTRVHHQTNAGIGGAFRAGAGLAAGDYLMLWPADMIPIESDLTPYFTKFGQADAIVGCRSYRAGYNPLMRLNAWLYPKLVASLFDLHLRDVNWIHAYRRDLFLRLDLTQSGIPMLAETLVCLRDAGATFVEVEVQMRPRTAGAPSAASLRVMIRTLQGLLAFWCTWRRKRPFPPP